MVIYYSLHHKFLTHIHIFLYTLNNFRIICLSSIRISM